MDGISKIGGELALAPVTSSEQVRPQAEVGDEVPFADAFEKALVSANNSGRHASEMAQTFAAGKSDDIHGTMIAAKEAAIELRALSNVRSKLLDAFNDLWRISV